MNCKSRTKKLIENQKFSWFITALIVVNFVVLIFSTEGFETALLENLILGVFALEVTAKIWIYRWGAFWAGAWNRFDLIIVLTGVLPLLGVPLPAGASGLRALRLLRLIGIIPAFRSIVAAIGNSVSQMSAVVGLTTLLLMICTLMATMSFQTTMPDEFASVFLSFSTLLKMATFNDLHLVGIAWEYSSLGTLLVFPLFFLGVPLMTLNLVIGVLSNALADEKAESDESKRLKDLQKRMDRIEKLLEKHQQK